MAEAVTQHNATIRAANVNLEPDDQFALFDEAVVLDKWRSLMRLRNRRRV